MTVSRVFCISFSGISCVGVNTALVAKISERYYDGQMRLLGGFPSRPHEILALFKKKIKIR